MAVPACPSSREGLVGLRVAASIDVDEIAAGEAARLYPSRLLWRPDDLMALPLHLLHRADGAVVGAYVRLPYDSKAHGIAL